MSFRQRLILLSAMAVAAAVVLASATVFVVVRGQLRSQVDDDLRDLVEEVTIPAVVSIRSVAGSEASVLILPTAPFGDPAGYAQVVQPNGNVIQPRGTKFQLPISRRTLEVAAGRHARFFEDRTIGGKHVRVLTTPVSGGAIQAVRSLADVDGSLRKLALALALISAAGIALAVWLGRLVARAALRPVNELTNAAEHVARTRDLSRRMKTGGTDELSRLGGSFNTMLEALDVSQRSQRQLVEDASHELRTPLTSLRTNIEVLAEANSLPTEDRRHLLRDVVRQLEELTSLVADLVDLSRGDDREGVAEDVRLDLLVAEAVERARSYSPDKRFSLEVEPCVVQGVAARLDRAVSNLLDNAAKWSPPEGEIEVNVKDGELSVRDHGPGIDPSDLPYVFDRFYRAPAARGLPGSGLGLAIVRQVAESHGGRVWAEAAGRNGALLRLRLPVTL
jgi:two-component system sensor histidine kinase MprB